MPKAVGWSFGSQSRISCPAFFNFSTVSCKARVTGGVGMQIPSFHSTATLSFLLMSTCRHGIGSIFGSTSHGFASTIAFEYIVMSSSVFPIGPFTLCTASWPARPDLHRCVVKRPKDGRSVKIPVHAAGIRKLPPCKKKLALLDLNQTGLTHNVSSNSQWTASECNES